MLTRRTFLCNTAAVMVFAPALSAGQNPFAAKVVAAGLGWQIGPQIYSFNRFDFETAIKKVVETGSTSFEQYPGMTVSKDIRVKVGTDLLKPENKAALNRVKELLAEYKLTMHAFGVCGGSRADFDFAAEFGIPVVNCEPGSAAKVEAVSKLTEEYKIRAGLHNHPKPSHYWDPQVVLDEIKNAGPLVGACVDTGHYVRSGLCPVESVQKLKGHITAFHIKDLKKTGDGKYDADCVMGKGIVEIAAVLEEAQGFKGPFSVEYEAAWDNNVKQITESIAYFESVVTSLTRGKIRDSDG